MSTFSSICRYFSNINSNLKIFQVGDKVSRKRIVTMKDIEEFSKISGDNNIVHSRSDSGKAIVHGAFLNSLVSSVIGTELPGHGTLVLKQTLNFPNKCFCDETVTTSVEIIKFRKIIEVCFKCVVESEDKTVLYGTAQLILKGQTND
ncbi:hypothetical protein WA026_003259 [Henosepilachna vigintioctopunctata]|uniref:MaoC-like domain-containing protein n=1 Tax=Henosepilachna vigintioctopunctata TaxID=420089 RepID=A0AAW1TP36_9CUCU